jgi:hypothetical protein
MIVKSGVITSQYFTKLNNIIIVSNKLQNIIISKSLIVQKFQNMFQVNSFDHKIIYF